MASTEYVVLRKTGHENWEEVEGFWIAGSATAAARNAAESMDVGGEYVGVPTRSFSPALIEIVTDRRARVSVVQEEIPEFPAKKEEEPAKS